MLHMMHWGNFNVGNSIEMNIFTCVNEEVQNEHTAQTFIKINALKKKSNSDTTKCASLSPNTWTVGSDVWKSLTYSKTIVMYFSHQTSIYNTTLWLLSQESHLCRIKWHSVVFNDESRLCLHASEVFLQWVCHFSECMV